MQKINLLDFRRAQGETLRFSRSLSLDEVDPSFSDVTIEGTLRNIVGVMNLRATVRATATVICDRCLDPAVYALQAELDTVVTVDGSKDESVAIAHGNIDWNKTAYDALVLALPTKKLCHPNCRGICPVCGKNRNTEPCGC